ncbi:MAG: hypothetical protein AAGH79_08395 [Bacteroidota bacterium]
MAIIKNGEKLISMSYNRFNKELTVRTEVGGVATDSTHPINSTGLLIKIVANPQPPNNWQIWMQDGKINSNKALKETAIRDGNFELRFVDGVPNPDDFIPEYVGIVDLRDARMELINFGGANDYEISMHSENRGTGTNPLDYHVVRVQLA